MTSKQYEQILNHAKAMCYSKYNINKSIEPTELLMQVYSDSQDIINDPRFVSLMRKRMRHFINFKEFDRHNYTDGIKYSKCVKCKAVKPSEEFNTYANVFTERKEIQKWCKSCVSIYHKTYYKTKTGKENRNKAFKNYVERNREQWNAYVRARFEKEKELLSDRYIKKILPFKVADITPEMIEKKRAELKQKRSELT